MTRRRLSIRVFVNSCYHKWIHARIQKFWWKIWKKRKKDREDPTRLKNNSVKKNLTILFLFTNYFLFVRRIYAYVMWTSSFKTWNVAAQNWINFKVSFTEKLGISWLFPGNLDCFFIDLMQLYCSFDFYIYKKWPCSCVS